MFTAICLVFSLYLLIIVNAQDQKPGSCHIPYGLDVGICPFYCKNDFDCGFYLKCCPTKCGGRACTVAINATAKLDPIQSLEESTTTTRAPLKLGACPGPLYTQKECGPLKFTGCKKDSQCVGNMKCCYNGCVNTCRNPQTARSGTCPRLSLPWPCRRRICNADSDCRPGLKCCSYGCLCTIPRGLGLGFGANFG